MWPGNHLWKDPATWSPFPSKVTFKKSPPLCWSIDSAITVQFYNQAWIPVADHFHLCAIRRQWPGVSGRSNGPCKSACGFPVKVTLITKTQRNRLSTQCPSHVPRLSDFLPEDCFCYHPLWVTFFPELNQSSGWMVSQPDLSICYIIKLKMAFWGIVPEKSKPGGNSMHLLVSV